MPRPPSSTPPPVELRFADSALRHLRAALVYDHPPKLAREAPAFVAALDLHMVRGSARFTIEVPCYALPRLKACFEAYAMKSETTPALKAVFVELCEGEARARRIAKDWANGDLEQADLPLR